MSERDKGEKKEKLENIPLTIHCKSAGGTVFGKLIYLYKGSPEQTWEKAARNYFYNNTVLLNTQYDDHCTAPGPFHTHVVTVQIGSSEHEVLYSRTLPKNK